MGGWFDVRTVSVVGRWPIPAPRMLHQLEQESRMSACPLRPVSMTKRGSKVGHLVVVCSE